MRTTVQSCTVQCTVLLLQSVSYILQRHLFIFVVTPSPTLPDPSLLTLKYSGVIVRGTKEHLLGLFGVSVILPKFSPYQQTTQYYVLDIIMPSKVTMTENVLLCRKAYTYMY